MDKYFLKYMRCNQGVHQSDVKENETPCCHLKNFWKYHFILWYLGVLWIKHGWDTCENLPYSTIWQNVYIGLVGSRLLIVWLILQVYAYFDCFYIIIVICIKGYMNAAKSGQRSTGTLLFSSSSSSMFYCHLSYTQKSFQFIGRVLKGVRPE